MPGDPNTIAVLGGALALAKPIVETGCRLIENLLGEPCKVAGAMLSDQIYYWQWTNRIRIAARAQQILDELHVAPRILPPAFVVPLLESAGNTDDAELQEMWAQLLAAGVVDEKSRHPAFVKIISQLCAEEALILKYLSRDDIHYTVEGEWRRLKGRLFSTHSVVKSTYDVTHLPDSALLHVYMEHLESVGIVEVGLGRAVPEDIPAGAEFSINFLKGEAHLTGFGKLFVTACTPQTTLQHSPAPAAAARQSVT